MQTKRMLHQDFLFEDLPVDEHDNPVVEIEYASNLNDDAVHLSFDLLLRLDKKEEWNDIYVKIKNKEVFIVDDVSLVNDEMTEYKMFYLKTYYFIISQRCKRCFVKNEIRSE